MVAAFHLAFAFRHNLQKYFSVVHSDCIHCMPFSMKKCAKMSVFYVKTVKVRWRLGASIPGPWLCSPFAKSWGDTDQGQGVRIIRSRTTIKTIASHTKRLLKKWYSQLSCLALSIKGSVKTPPQCGRQTDGSCLTRRPKGHFAVSRPRQLR